jgi:zinc transport system substrate-binding protein
MTNKDGGLLHHRGMFIVILSLITVLYLSGSSSLAQSHPLLKVVTTLFPLQEFARAVGGENAQVEMIIPPGVEPHAWEPKPSDVTKTSQADVFIYIGPAMEPWAADLLKATRGARLKVVEASRGLSLLEAKDSRPAPPTDQGQGREGKVDPHLWLDFSLDLKIVDAIAAAFAEKDPGEGSRYRANAEAYNLRLDALDKKFQSSLSSCRQRQIILGGHSAYSYLAKRYGLQQIPLYGISPNAEPTPRKLTVVINAAKNHGAKYIFFEELVNPKLAQVLAQEAGLQTLVLNDGANLTREQIKQKVTFLGLMEKNLENLRRGLDCGPQ